MFYSTRPNLYQSDEGFSVEILGRTGMKYKESNKTMQIGAEVLMTDLPSVAIWKDSMKAWDAPDDREEIDEATRVAILKRICQALKWRGINVEIHSMATGWTKGWLE